MSTLKSIPIKDTDSPVVKRIKQKLNASAGIATIPLYSGEKCDIWFEEGGRGLLSSKIPPSNQLVWQVFDAAVQVVIDNGGKAKRKRTVWC